MPRSLVSFFIAAFVLLAPVVSAQVDPNVEQGLKPYGSYHGGEIDKINLANGNLFVRVPIYSLPQRGNKLHFGFSLQYNNKGYTLNTTGSCPIPKGVQSCEMQYVGSGNGFSGPVSGVSLIYDQGIFTGYVSVDAGAIEYNPTQYPNGCLTPNGYANPCTIYVNEYSAVTSDGSVHQMADTGNGYYESIDASGIRFNLSTGVTTDAGGVQYRTAGTQDPNGNQITLSQGVYTDTVGRTVSSVGTSASTSLCPSLGYSFQPVTSATQFSWPGPNNTSAVYTMCYTTVNYLTDFWNNGGNPVGCQGGNTCEREATGSFTPLQSVILPNGTYYAFQYDAANPNGSTTGYGDLLKIILPTGGSIEYTYTNQAVCTNSLEEQSRAILTRTVNANDGTGAHTWTYNAGIVTSPPVNGATVGDDTVHVITPLGGTGCSLYETETDYYSGSHTTGTLLKTVKTTYSYGPNPFAPQLTYVDGHPIVVQLDAGIVPASVTTIWPAATGQTSGIASEITTSYDTGLSYRDPLYGNTQLASPPNTPYPSTFGRRISSVAYDYGSGTTPGAALKQSATTYSWQSGTNAAAYLAANMLDLPISVVTSSGTGVKCAETDYGYDVSARLFASGISTQHGGTVGAVRGNVSSVAKQLSTTPCQTGASWSPLTAYSNVYDTGEVYQSIDPKGNTTTYAYSATYAGAYPTTITNALSQYITNAYDFNTGLLTSVTDLNQQITTNTYDNMMRLTNITYPTSGGQTAFCYTDEGGTGCTQAGAPYDVVVTQAISSSLNKVGTGIVDGVGRVTETQLNSDPDGTDDVDTTYDARGRKLTESNPHRAASSSTDGITTYTYDALNRVTAIAEPDTSQVLTSYAANSILIAYCTTVTDEALNSRQSCVDGLGRMTSVWEAPNGANYETDYSYDTLGDVLSVTQKGGASSGSWRTRSFQYDSLSRITSATNPESGTITYAYDADGNVISKTAPLPNQTGSLTVTATYTYDQLNRLTSETYKDGTVADPYTPPVLFGYDGVAPTGCTKAPPILPDSYPIGRRTSMCDGSGSTSWDHDQMGRTLQDARFIGAVTPAKLVSYGFNLDGSLSFLTTPPMKYIAYQVGGAGRTLSVKDTVDNINFVTSATYAPPGELQSLTNGGAIYGAVAYNSRLQPMQFFYGTNTPPAIPSMNSTCPSTVGNIMNNTYNFGFGSGDNGNVLAITNCRDTTRTQSFAYDALNRIVSAQSSGSQWGETFTIDAWGNMTNESQITGKTNHEGLNAAPATNQNRLTGFGYDAAGNMTSNGSASYIYDAENRLIWTSGERYIYDGDGNRVEKCVAATATTACPTSGTNGMLYWRGTGSEALDESDLSGNPEEEYIFFSGQRIARRDVTSTGATIAVHYYFSDHLGSHSVITNATGTTCEQDIDYYPYGGVENDYCSGSGVSQRYKFTGKERDTESGLDYFGARHYASNLARFMVPDWAAKPTAVPYANFGNPQSLNLYSYVENSPVSRVDPIGHATEDAFYNSGGFGDPSTTLAFDWMSSAVEDEAEQDAAAPQPAPAQPQAQNNTTGRQPDGSYVAATGPGSEVAKIDAAADEGKPVPLVGSGECVALTSKLTGVTDHTPDWTQGPKVVNVDGTINSAVKPGTAIAAGWDANGHYPRGNVPKNSGVFLGPGVASGKGSIGLMDQWKAHPPNPANPPQSRDVRFYSDPSLNVSNNSNSYYVIIVR
jgi:RHS repeat-associated protein